MDLVSRIKTFMSSQGLTNSQFADSCQISRPTLSQILLGRNKKVSNEIIEKIHATYPWLNVMWLMFGEGDMTLDQNIKISEPQIALERHDSQLYSQNNQISYDVQDEGVLSLDFGTDAPISDSAPQNASGSPDHKPAAASDNATNIGDAIRSFVNSRTGRPASESEVADPKAGMKRISSIVVFYDDNSFESFLPAGLI